MTTVQNNTAKMYSPMSIYNIFSAIFNSKTVITDDRVIKMTNCICSGITEDFINRARSTLPVLDRVLECDVTFLDLFADCVLLIAPCVAVT